MTIVNFILGVLLFLVVIMISIGLHELGHLSVAKSFKLHVPRYFVGFGKTLFSFKRKGTEYGLKAIPLGGYVIIEDSTQEESAPERVMLSHVNPLKRIAVLLAGPAVNIVLGTVIIMITLMSFPVQKVVPEVKTVNSCPVAGAPTQTFTSPDQAKAAMVCNAAKAGLQSNDKITEVDGQQVNAASDLPALLAGKQQVMLTLDRNGEIVHVSSKVTDNLIGINLKTADTHLSAAESAGMIGNVFISNVRGLADIPGKVPGIAKSIVGIEEPDKEAPSSIVSVGKTYGDTAASTDLNQGNKARSILLYTGLLNIGLGVINLVPIAPLDGGRILFAVFDIIKAGFARLTRRRYHPVSFKTINAITLVTASVVFSFMGMVILADILKIIRGQM